MITLTFLFLLTVFAKCSEQINITAVGPGLHPLDIVLPARYFFVNFTFINEESYSRQLSDDLYVDVKGRSKYGFCRSWVSKLDRKDGTFIVRYKLYEPCEDMRINVVYKNEHITGSPFNFKGLVFPDTCNCPQNEFEDWLSRYQCAKSNNQIQEDLKLYKHVNFTKISPLVWSKFTNPRSVSICQYVVKSNNVYRKCFGEHVGFNMFVDNILLSLTRKVLMPDVQFFMNLGDWPLGKTSWDEPLPIFSWCGSNDTYDIVLPTYDLTESSLENMGRVMLDMLSVQGNNDIPWENKIAKGFWRGRDSRLERLTMIDIARQNSDLFNASITNFFFFLDKKEEYGPKQPHESFFKFFNFKYQINIDGTVAAYRFPYLLAGDAVVFKQDSPYYENFYKQLKPYEHFIPFKRDLSDLKEKILWAKENDEAAKAIGRNGRKFANENLLPKDAICYHAVLLSEWAKRLTDEVTITDDMVRVEQAKESLECDCNPLPKRRDEFR